MQDDWLPTEYVPCGHVINMAVSTLGQALWQNKTRAIGSIILMDFNTQLRNSSAYNQNIAEMLAVITFGSIDRNCLLKKFKIG